MHGARNIFQCFGALLMTKNRLSPITLCPAPVPVHDDGDMVGSVIHGKIRFAAALKV
jgi:hypothetical protein